MPTAPIRRQMASRAATKGPTVCRRHWEKTTTGILFATVAQTAGRPAVAH